MTAGQQEGSPSKLTTQSGIFFGKGYANGIISMMKPVNNAARNLAEEAVSSISDSMNDQMLQIGLESGKSLADGMQSGIPRISASVANLKNGVASANSQINGVGSFGGSGMIGGHGNSTQNVTFNQTINSPKPLSRLAVYRETNNLLFSAKVRLNNV